MLCLGALQGHAIFASLSAKCECSKHHATADIFHFGPLVYLVGRYSHPAPQARVPLHRGLVRHPGGPKVGVQTISIDISELELEGARPLSI